MYECMSVRVYECMSVRVYECMSVCDIRLRVVWRQEKRGYGIVLPIKKWHK